MERKWSEANKLLKQNATNKFRYEQKLNTGTQRQMRNVSIIIITQHKWTPWNPSLRERETALVPSPNHMTQGEIR